MGIVRLTVSVRKIRGLERIERRKVRETSQNSEAKKNERWEGRVQGHRSQILWLG